MRSYVLIGAAASSHTLDEKSARGIFSLSVSLCGGPAARKKHWQQENTLAVSVWLFNDYDREHPGGGDYTGYVFNVAYARAMMQAVLAS